MFPRFLACRYAADDSTETIRPRTKVTSKFLLFLTRSLVQKWVRRSVCVGTRSKGTVAVVSTAAALVNVYKKGTVQVSVIITFVTVFFVKEKQLF